MANPNKFGTTTSIPDQSNQWKQSNISLGQQTATDQQVENLHTKHSHPEHYTMAPYAPWPLRIYKALQYYQSKISL